MNNDSSNNIPIEIVASKNLLIRGQKVMLDSDLAEFYRVTTGALNQAVKRNLNRFPADFMFQLSLNEATALKSQIVTSNEGRGGRRKLQSVFTEHGVVMLASVLRSKRAAEISIFIVRAFVRIREILSSNKELAFKIQELEREQKMQNKHINAIYSMLDKLLEEPPKPKEPIGFRAP